MQETVSQFAPPSAGSDSDVVKFEQVLKHEYEAIHTRRGHQTKEGKPENLFGVALSGGGIRSACFSLGALQALHLYDVIPKIDYLSTVSGGGYIGTSMVAALTHSAQNQPKREGTEGPSAASAEHLDFPFADTPNGSDSIEVKHLRDNSRFLAPNGLGDIGVSLAIILRGLMVNFLLLLTVMLPLATLLILSNPTTAYLRRSLIADLIPFLFCPNPNWNWCLDLNGTRGWQWLEPYISDPWIMSKSFAAALCCWLIGWALSRSIVDFAGGARAKNLFEPSSKGASLGKWLLTLLFVAIIVEVQPFVINLAIWLQTKPDVGFTLKALASTTTALIASIAAFRGTLIAWIERSLNSKKTVMWLQGLLAQAAFYALGLALPLLLYGIFIMLVAWGIDIQPLNADPPLFGYALGPRWLTGDNHFWWFTVGAVALIGASWLVSYCSGAKAGAWRDRLAFLADRLRPPKVRPSIAFYIVGALVFMTLSAAAVRRSGAEDQWQVLCNYLGLTFSVWLITLFFTENANGLHRLYRDRLQGAFGLGKTEQEGMELHELSELAPYLLVNGTLNVRRSNGTTKSTEFDPAKRGRNAEFFVFSRKYVGSDATGYAPAEKIAKCENQLDLATAAAISGAAISSSMGRINIGLLGPTLAMLNLRLGFWLTNPSKLRYWQQYRGDIDAYRKRAATQDEARRARADKAAHTNQAMTEDVESPVEERGWDEYMRLYLFQEAFGILKSNSSRIYITDGGHLDNLGLYQLLKRKCKLIIVVDAEADPGMNFGAFCDVERFIRIDQGTRIELDWQSIRETVIKRQEDRAKREPRTSLAQLHHFAIGRIVYADQEEGLLLYIKAAATGDEPDYVLDYERRNPLFPHESTGNQFFSEEQMEAYRALGFHSVKRAFDGLPIDDTSEAYRLQQERVRRFRCDLEVKKYVDDWRQKARREAVAQEREG